MKNVIVQRKQSSEETTWSADANERSWPYESKSTKSRTKEVYCITWTSKYMHILKLERCTMHLHVYSQTGQMYITITCLFVIWKNVPCTYHSFTDAIFPRCVSFREVSRRVAAAVPQDGRLWSFSVGAVVVATRTYPEVAVKVIHGHIRFSQGRHCYTLQR